MAQRPSRARLALFQPTLLRQCGRAVELWSQCKNKTYRQLKKPPAVQKYDGQR